MKLKELRARLLAIVVLATGIANLADAETEGVFTADQVIEFDKLVAEKETVQASIVRAEQLEKMTSSQGRVVTPGLGEPAAIVTMGVEQDPMNGFSSAAEFGRIVQAATMPGGEVDQRLQIMGAATNFHRETNSNDGYMVPPAMRDEIWTLVYEAENILSSVNPEPTESNSVQMSADESTPWGSTGIQAFWGSEGGQLQKSRLETDGRTVQLNKLHAYVLATDELISDAPRLANRLTVGAANAISFKADQAIIEGDGKGKPLGWMKSGALVVVAKEAGQTATTIVTENVLKMFSRLIMSGASGAYWLINSSTIPQLATMVIGTTPIWTPPSSGLTNAPGGTLLGLPIRFSEHCETVGSQGDIQLVAPNGYYAVNKAGGVDFKSSMHLYFDHDIEAFKWTFRIGGQPFMRAPQTPAKGSDTKSHFITLAERA
jgi:HK97 family phage major capsid protein